MAEAKKMKMRWPENDGLNWGVEEACACCGKAMKRGAQNWYVHVVEGGANVLHPSSEAEWVEEAGEMGYHKIGAGCAKKHFPGFAVRW